MSADGDLRAAWPGVEQTSRQAHLERRRTAPRTSAPRMAGDRNPAEAIVRPVAGRSPSPCHHEFDATSTIPAAAPTPMRAKMFAGNRLTLLNSPPIISSWLRGRNLPASKYVLVGPVSNSIRRVSLNGIPYLREGTTVRNEKTVWGAQFPPRPRRGGWPIKKKAVFLAGQTVMIERPINYVYHPAAQRSKTIARVSRLLSRRGNLLADTLSCRLLGRLEGSGGVE